MCIYTHQRYLCGHNTLVFKSYCNHAVQTQIVYPLEQQLPDGSFGAARTYPLDGSAPEYWAGNAVAPPLSQWAPAAHQVHQAQWQGGHDRSSDPFVEWPENADSQTIGECSMVTSCGPLYCSSVVDLCYADLDIYCTGLALEGRRFHTSDRRNVQDQADKVSNISIHRKSTLVMFFLLQPQSEIRRPCTCSRSKQGRVFVGYRRPGSGAALGTVQV